MSKNKRNRGAGRYIRTKSKRQKVYQKTNKRCAYCGREIYETVPDNSPIKLTIDHIKPISQGGHKSDIGNLICACQECNCNKADSKLKTFRNMLMKGYEFYFECMEPA